MFLLSSGGTPGLDGLPCQLLFDKLNFLESRSLSLASSTVNCWLYKLTAGESRCLKVVVCTLRMNGSPRFEISALKVLVCALSGSGEPDSPGGHPGKSKPVGDKLFMSCLVAGFALFFDLALAVKAMATGFILVFHQWRKSLESARFKDKSSAKDSGLSLHDEDTFIMGHIEDILLSQEKFRVMLMTIANGAMSS